MPFDPQGFDRPDATEELLARAGVQSGVAGVMQQIRQQLRGKAAPVGELSGVERAALQPSGYGLAAMEDAARMRNSVFWDQWSQEHPEQAQAYLQLEQARATADPGNWVGAGVTKVAKAAKEAVPLLDRLVAAPLEDKVAQTVGGGQRIAFPEIYGNPADIASTAAANVAPEDVVLKQLFGVTRGELADVAASRTGNVEPQFQRVAKPKGSAAAEGVMTPENTQRIVDVLSEARKHPDLYQGMTGWYVMDPAYNRILELVGGDADKAKALYERFNTMTGMASPMSDVLTEINRGTAANWMAEQGRFGEFAQKGGKPAAWKTENAPELAAVHGHPAHSTAQAPAMAKYLETGRIQSGEPKVPAYIAASGVPEVGFQTRYAVPDAHWARAVGLADTRTAASYKGSASMPEMESLWPWWRQDVAGAAGMEAVPAQALAWGTFGHATGVETAVGAPKLELLAQQIRKAAKREGISMEEARDKVLLGQMHAGKIDPQLAVGMGLGAGAAAAAAPTLRSYFGGE